MNKKLIALNLLLVGSVLLSARYFQREWKAYEQRHQIARLTGIEEKTVATRSAAAKEGEVPNYSAIVDKDLFALDRNNLIAVDPPAHTSFMAPKPVLMGTLELDAEAFALMISGDPRQDNSNYKRIKIGDSLDGYTLTKILDQKVLMTAEGKEVEVRLNEPSKLVARDQGPAGSVGAPGNGNRVTSVGSSNPVTGATTSSEQPKAYIPPGTIVNGRRKIVVPSPFGPMESWEEVK